MATTRRETVTHGLPADPDASAPSISVVIPLYNEAASIPELYRRTVASLDEAGHAFELIFVDDGSTDSTFAELDCIHAADGRVRAVRFKRNFGQHAAMHAGLVRARGEILVTMDGDLQNAPEDLPRLVHALESGVDVASGTRAARRDSWGRTLPSHVINGMLRRFTRVEISDFGCAFNAYRRSAIEPMLGAIGKQKFTKALVLSSGASVVEVDVTHSPRTGRSRYTPLRLTRLALHVLAGFWPQPIQWIGITLGVLCSTAALVLGVYGVFYWIERSNFPGPLFGGVAVIFVLGMQGFILALVGEYLARIQRDVEAAQDIESVGGQRLRFCEEQPERPGEGNERCRNKGEDQRQQDETFRPREPGRAGAEVEDIRARNIELESVDRDDRDEREEKERERRKSKVRLPRRQNSQPHPKERRQQDEVREVAEIPDVGRDPADAEQLEK